MASNLRVRISHVFQVLPSNPANSFSFPLSYIDMIWFNWHPVERLFFYELPDLNPSTFLDTILPKLENSLSITLSHFLHAAGIVTWPQDSQRPIIQYNPGDSVSLTVAISEDGSDFINLSGDHAKEAIALHALVPKLPISDTQASAIALQVMLFPEYGLVIGIKFHHSVLDGKSSTMFMKAWAHVFKNMQENKDAVTLTPELTPVFDTKLVKVPNDVDKFFELMETSTQRSPNRSMPMDDTEYAKGLVRATFKLTKADINFLKNISAFWQEKRGKENVHISTFMVTFAYVLVCMLKTTGLKSDQKTVLGFAADFRARLDPTIPTNYGGNCTGIGAVMPIEGKELEQEDVVAIMAEKLSNGIRGINRTIKEGKLLCELMNKALEPGIRVISVAGSPRLEVYDTDFGWGKPKKVEVVSINPDTMALAEDKDHKGGIEVGLIMNPSEVEHFTISYGNTFPGIAMNEDKLSMCDLDMGLKTARGITVLSVFFFFFFWRIFFSFVRWNI